MKDDYEIRDYLKKNQPILYIEALKATERNDELMEFCKGLRDNYELYTYYVLEYLEPWFESLRRQNRLVYGQKKIEVLGCWVHDAVEYSGELLDGEIATGNGEYTNKWGDKFVCQFLDNRMEGMCI